MPYRISHKGKVYIQNPSRNIQGVIPQGFYKNLIVIYSLIYGKYTPEDFKQYVKNLNILKQKDFAKTENHPQQKWSHYIDAAKEVLFNKDILAYESNGVFSLNRHRKEVSDVIDNYLEMLI
jgi:hypothetical protein